PYVVVNGEHLQGWAFGLAAAGLSARHGAPVLLTADGQNPPELEGFLDGCQRTLAIVGVGGRQQLTDAQLAALQALVVCA
ncbi:MAG TPA: cell wall-binding repeat-containing protein, partial [Nitriliruptorales bacterium]